MALNVVLLRSALALILVLGGSAVVPTVSDDKEGLCLDALNDPSCAIVWSETLEGGEYLYVEYVLPEPSRTGVTYRSQTLEPAETDPNSYGQGGFLEAGPKRILIVNYGDYKKQVSATLDVDVPVEQVVVEKANATYVPFETDDPFVDRAVIQMDLEEAFYVHLIHPVPGTLDTFRAQKEGEEPIDFQPSPGKAGDRNWRGPEGLGTRLPAVVGSPGSWEFEVELTDAARRMSIGLGLIRAPEFIDAVQEPDGTGREAFQFEPLQVLSALGSVSWSELAHPIPVFPDDRLVYVGVP